MLESPELALGISLAEAVGFLQLAQQLIPLASNDIQVIVGQLAPTRSTMNRLLVTV